MKIPFYVVGGIRIWGYDLVDPKQDFSVSEFIKIAPKIIKNVRLRGKLPILVGGTGLYIKGVVDGIETSDVPKNDNLRKELADKKTNELFEMLAVFSPVKAASLNQSDRKNSRRLLRAIEVAKWKAKNGVKKTKTDKPDANDVLFIGLMAPSDVLVDKIKVRVHSRVISGVEKEIQSLLQSGVLWSMQSMDTLGYKEWVDYFMGNKNKEDVTEKWVRGEKNYAKRQKTWFKKDKRINWYDITKSNWRKSIEKQVKRWHNEVHA